MNSFYFKTFARVCLLPYIGGTISQILRLIYNVNNDLMPKEVSWIVIVLGLYGAPGLFTTLYRRNNFSNSQINLQR